MLSRLLPDRFILWLLLTVGGAVILPVAGRAAQWLDLATLGAIFLLFFLHGVRLPREALIAGTTRWRLHLVIGALTFCVFPLLGLLSTSATEAWFPPEVGAGLLFLCLLPSTVQSSIAFTSLAGGNVAGAVAAAAFSNLAGVFLTPLLATLLLQADGIGITTGSLVKIFGLLFLPFLLGHGLRPYLKDRVARSPALVAAVDKGTILLAVYGAFSAATVAGIWHRLPAADLFLLSFLLLALLGAVLLAAVLAGRAFGFPRVDRAAILFCGSVKSLASGAPMARILFPGAAAGAIILPLMLFHTFQLIVCAWIAAAMAGRRPRKTRQA